MVNGELAPVKVKVKLPRSSSCDAFIFTDVAFTFPAKVILGVDEPEPITTTPTSCPLVVSDQVLEPVGLRVIVAGRSDLVNVPASELIVKFPEIFKVGS